MSALRVAIDARQLALGPSGDRTYLLSLLREYPALVPDWEFALCYGPAGGPGDGTDDLAHNFSVHPLAASPGWLWTPVTWSRFLRRERMQVAHAQYLVPPRAPCPTVVTIHDVSFVRHPEWFPAPAVRVMRRLIPWSARWATRIITGSDHAADEIAALCRVPRAKVAVIPYAAGPQFTPGDRAAARECVAAAHGLTGPYVLAVGLIQPRKNLPRLLEAFGRMARGCDDLTLAIAGKAGPGAEAVRQQVADLGLADLVRCCGLVPDADLPELYRAAELLVYPSLHEGFGLPALEAMACGTPVVASNTTSLPEVVGDAGLLVDPLSVADIAQAMRRVLDDDGLAAQLAAAGLARARQFSWRTAAEGHLALFRELAESGR
jgi:glycosyltransferase involved in cell wall biosynthesis